MFFLFLGYIFLPYVRGPCSPYLSNGEVYKMYTNKTSQVQRIGISYKIYRGESISQMYFHKVDKQNRGLINVSDVHNAMSSTCSGDKNCIQIISDHVIDKLNHALKHETRKHQCFTMRGFLEYLSWSIRSNFSWCFIRLHPTGTGKIFTIDNLDNPDQDIRIFMGVNGLNDINFEKSKTMITQHIKNYKKVLGERLLSFKILICGAAFALIQHGLYNTLLPLSEEHDEVPMAERKTSQKMQQAESLFYCIDRIKWIASLFLVFSHSFVFTGQIHMEPVRKHFGDRKEFHSLGNICLTCHMCISGFLCATPSILIGNKKRVGLRWDTCCASLRTCARRCDRLLSQYFLAVIVCSVVASIAACSERGWAICRDDIAFQRGFLQYILSSVEHAMFALLPTTLLPPKASIENVFHPGNAINESLWTIPHHVFCYFLLCIVDIFSGDNRRVKLQFLITLYTMFYAMRATQISNSVLNSKEGGWNDMAGHHRRFALYTDFILGGICRYVMKNVNVQCTANLVWYLSFTPLIMVPWIFRESQLFELFYPPFLCVLIFCLSQSLLLSNIGRSYNNAVFKSSKILFYFGATIQKILVIHFNVVHPVLVTTLTAVLCICVYYLNDSIFHKYVSGDSQKNIKPLMPGIYGQAAIVPDRSVVGNILKEYLDVLFTPANNKNKKEE